MWARAISPFLYMEFYTNIQVSGDNVLVRSIDGVRRLKYREEFFTTLYPL